MDIDSMPAGREMDALVAEKVMGWMNLGPCEFQTDGAMMGDPPPGFCEQLGRPWQRFVLPEYSTSISAAWAVVDHVRRTHPRRPAFDLVAGPHSTPVQAVFFTACLEWGDSMYELGPEKISMSSAHEAPLAICRSALKAVGIK